MFPGCSRLKDRNAKWTGGQSGLEGALTGGIKPPPEAFLLQAKKQRQARLHQKEQQPPKTKRNSKAATCNCNHRGSSEKEKTQAQGQVAILAGQQLNAKPHSLVPSSHTRRWFFG
jgi:hypothetical protein